MVGMAKSTVECRYYVKKHCHIMVMGVTLAESIADLGCHCGREHCLFGVIMVKHTAGYGCYHACTSIICRSSWNTALIMQMPVLYVIHYGMKYFM